MTIAVDLSGSKRALLQRMLSGKSVHATHGGGAVTPRPAGVIPPLSVEQSDIWLHASMAPEVALYNESVTIHRKGPFDLAALENSLNEVLRRHEIWRTSFQDVNGELRQIVHPELHLKLDLIDLTHLPEGRREEEATRIATEDARRPFDLARLPLLRPRVVRFAPDNHRLYLTLHHIIFDGVSLARTVVPELTRFYDDFAAGRMPIIARPALQYGDYAVWRGAQVSDDAISRALDYWRGQFAGEVPFLNLPTDRPRPATLTHRGSLERFSIAPSLATALKALNRKEGVTLYATLLTAFKTLLYRYSGQDDITIGGVTDARRRPELENVVGYFLNSMALRTRPAPALSFRDYLHQVKNTVLSAIEAGIVPFERTVRALQPKRDPSRHPLFQILFSMEPALPSFAEGWDMTQADAIAGAAKFDIYIEMDERAGGLIGRFFYSTDLFDPATIRRMISHWTRLMEGIAADPNCALAQVPLLPHEEIHQLHVEWNKTERPIPYPTLSAWFDAQVLKTPDAVAVEAADRRLTYRELDHRVEQLAAQLQDAGVGPEILVAVAVERSQDLPVCLLAVLRAGGAYLPLDTSLPPARIAMFLDDARPSLVLTQRALRRRFIQSGLAVVLCDEPVRNRVADKVRCGAGPGSLAYILYTSGSTGKPKAVEICHQGLVNELAAIQADPGFTASDKMLAIATISFDIAILELFLPLVSGGCTIIASREDAFDPSRLAALIDRSGCTVMQATTATWRMLCDAGWTGSKRLKKILCGADALTEELAGKLLACGVELWNVYGPTETTIWSLQHKVDREPGPVPIGRPHPNTRAYILDAQGAPVPIGVPGELYIAGIGLGRGYRNDTNLTASKFVTLPHLSEERLYRTGDLARYRPDGLIEYLGRTDNQVKIRGFRVGLEEVEAAILAHPQVAAAAAKAWPDASGGTSLAAYVVWKEKALPVSELLEFLRQSLPDFMVPSRILTLDALPMTPARKVDRKQLPEPSPAAPRGLSGPRDELERLLFDIWTTVLGTPEIDIHQNFFDLGGHSLLAFKVVAEIKSAMGAELRPATFFRAPTIAGLAKVLRSMEDEPFSYLVPLKREGTDRPLFIVHALFGNVLELRNLAHRLRCNRPVYALQARGLDPKQPPHSRVEDMAERYVSEIFSVQPRGPYALAGYSFGGSVAFEMARRLRQIGEEVELVALLDTDVHERNLPVADWIKFQISRIVRVSRKAAALSPGHSLSYLYGLASNRLLLRIGRRKHSHPLVENWPDFLPAQIRDVHENCIKAFNAFRPRRYPGRVSFYRVATREPQRCDPLPVWRRVSGGVDVFRITGEHLTMMQEPHVTALAEALSRSLNRHEQHDVGSEAARGAGSAKDRGFDTPLAAERRPG